MEKILEYRSLNVCYYLGWYFPRRTYDRLSDPLSRELLKFKDGDPNTIQAWKNFILSESTNIDDICEAKWIVRALGSDETSADNQKPLDSIGISIATSNDSKYIKQNLIKSIVNRPLHTMSRNQRSITINNQYTFRPPADMGENDTILIIDDILTTGTTLNEISRSILNERPSTKIINLILLKTYDRRVDIRVNNTGIYYSKYCNFKI